MRNLFALNTSYKHLKHWILDKGNFSLHPRITVTFLASKRFSSNESKFKIQEKNSIQKRVIPKKFNFASDVIDEWAKKEKDGTRTSTNPAFWFVYQNGKEFKLTFQELKQETERMANIFETSCGIKRGDNVMVILPKIPEFWMINLAAMRVGFVMCPVNMMLTAKDLSHRLTALETTSVIAHESIADVIDEISQSCSTLKNKIIISDLPSRRKGWIDFNRLQSVKVEHKCADTDSDETMMIFFTSGTTGNPKMVEHTHASYGIGLQTAGKYSLGITSDSILWVMADTGWAFTTYGLIGAWSQGSCLFIHQMLKFCPRTILDVLSKYPIDSLSTAPLAYRFLTQEDLSNWHFKNLKFCFTGGESLNSEILRKWKKKTGLNIYSAYGLTESTDLISQQQTVEYRIGSMGTSVPGKNVTIVDENENVLGPREIGEIVLERENQIGIFKGYRNNPEATAAALTDKYFHTGDMGYYDEDEYFWYSGRKDDQINSAGYRIGPSEVEDALMEHPAVLEAAVVSSPDEKRGEVVKAFIVLHESINPSNDLIKEIQDHCKRITAPYKYPRKIEFIKDLPKTLTGKTKRSELKKKEWSVS